MAHQPGTQRDAGDDSGGSLSSCFQQVFFLFLSVILIVVVLGAGLTSGSQAHAFDQTDCQISERFPEKVRKWCGLITRNALNTGLQPDLVAALIWQESGGNELAYSHSGAVGLMQVMPRDGIAASFRCKGQPCFQNRPTIQELQDPKFNVQYGTKMLQGLVKHNRGDLREALKDYGPINVGYDYADIVLGLYRSYGKSTQE